MSNIDYTNRVKVIINDLKSSIVEKTFIMIKNEMKN